MWACTVRALFLCVKCYNRGGDSAWHEHHGMHTFVDGIHTGYALWNLGIHM